MTRRIFPEVAVIFSRHTVIVFYIAFRFYAVTPDLPGVAA
jgi:hypothetical protein